MARLNVGPTYRTPPLRTHEGGIAKRISPELQLRRAVMACLLWEKNFYESGEDIATRISSLVPIVGPQTVASMAVEARTKMKLRHVPLLLVREMAKYEKSREYVSLTLSRCIQRADELTEFLAIYWKDKKTPLSAQVKKGLAQAFTKFDEYQLAKYNRSNDSITLRDVLFLVHARPESREQAALWKRLVDNELVTPDTWEVNLSAGKDKRDTFERLMSEGKLGGLALLRNLRNIKESQCNESLVIQAIETMRTERILPFRFITAARFAPQWEDSLEKSMLRCLEGVEKLEGKTVLLIDVSGSMNWKISDQSEVFRIDVANGLAIIAREMAESQVQVYSFSEALVRVPSRHGFALRDVINDSQPHGSTKLGSALTELNKTVDYDRIIVITDEQSQDTVPNPHTGSKGYMINVSTNQNGVGYGAWTHIDGFSEATLTYIQEFEKVGY